MIAWQFITLIALIGALLLYASIVARRLGRVDARLTRIEETLLAKSSIDSTDKRADESTPEVVDEKTVGGPYLTVRDLRVRSERERSRDTRPSIRNSGPPPEWFEALRATRDLMKPPGAIEKDEVESVRVSSESREARDEPLSTGNTSPPPAHFAPTSLESQDAAADPISNRQTSVDSVTMPSEPMRSENLDAPAIGNEPQNPSSQQAASDDSVTRKNRDTALFLSNQRRRRRARLGY